MYIYTLPNTDVGLGKPHRDIVASPLHLKPSWLKLHPQHPPLRHITYIKPIMWPLHRSVHIGLVTTYHHRIFMSSRHLIIIKIII